MRQPDTLSTTWYQNVKRQRIRRIVQAVEAELYRAMELHGPMHSHHEAWSVIFEELEEYRDDVVRAKDPKAHPEAAFKELIQTAAMCARACFDLEVDPEFDPGEAPE